jgi:hypothetical protein
VKGNRILSILFNEMDINNILSILNERSGFKVGASNSVCEVNVGTSFQILNNVKSCMPLDALTLNSNHKNIPSSFPTIFPKYKNKTTFYFPIKKHHTAASLHFSIYH